MELTLYGAQWRARLVMLKFEVLVAQCHLLLRFRLCSVIVCGRSVFAK
jgi:hypothetical protein